MSKTTYTDAESAKWIFLFELVNSPEGLDVPSTFNPNNPKSILRCIGARELLHDCIKDKIGGESIVDEILDSAKKAYHELLVKRPGLLGRK